MEKITKNKLAEVISNSIDKVLSDSPKFKVYMMVGIPGAGKSTWIKNNLGNIPVVSRDIIRAELGYTKNADEKAVLSKEGEQQVTVKEYEKINQYAKSQTTFAIDDTNTGKFRKGMIDKLHELGAYVVGVNIDTPLEVCIQRRDGQIPADVMRRIHQNKINLLADEVDEIINV